MRFSTQNLLSLREGQSHAEVYANTLDECRLAEELGFHTVWLAEHHFSAYGIAPSLGVLAAALAREAPPGRAGPAGPRPLGGRFLPARRFLVPPQAGEDAAPAALDRRRLPRHLHAGRQARAQ